MSPEQLQWLAILAAATSGLAAAYLIERLSKRVKALARRVKELEEKLNHTPRH